MREYYPLIPFVIYVVGVNIYLMGHFKERLMKIKRAIIIYTLIGFLVFGWAANFKCEGYANRANECSIAWGIFWPVTALGTLAMTITNPDNYPTVRIVP